MKIIFSNFHNSSEIKESNLIINDKEYKVDLDGNFFDTSNAAIWLFSDRYYVLEKNGIDGELYTSKEYEHTFGNTKDELIKRFPGLLKIPPNDIPDYSKVQKNQLRLFGNLIYAPNGYIFKSYESFLILAPVINRIRILRNQICVRIKKILLYKCKNMK